LQSKLCQEWLAAAQVQGNGNPVFLAGSIQPKDPDLALFKRRLCRPLLGDGPDIPQGRRFADAGPELVEKPAAFGGAGKAR
jgi:hypothetical protein